MGLGRGTTYYVGVTIPIPPSASEVTTIWRYTNVYIIVIIIIKGKGNFGDNMWPTIQTLLIIANLNGPRSGVHTTGADA